MRLAGKIAIVTGAASGFGRGIAEAFAREGANVMIADRDTKGAAQVAAGIGQAAVPFTCDVSLKADVDAMVAACVQTFGGLDILVNNAGVTHKNQSLLTVTEEDFDRIYAVNVRSIYLTTLAAVPELEKRGGGSIIITASTAGVRPRPASPGTTAPRARPSRLRNPWPQNSRQRTSASTPSIPSSAKPA